jgi:hypothetical protein
MFQLDSSPGSVGIMVGTSHQFAIKPFLCQPARERTLGEAFNEFLTIGKNIIYRTAPFVLLS